MTSQTRQATLGGDTKVGGKQISAVLDEQDPEDLEILGWAVSFTIGNDFVVDRDWLEDRAEELGIPQYLLPNKTGKKRAFGRAANRLTREERSWDEHVDIDVSVYKEAHNEYHLEVTDRRYDDVTTSKIGKFVYDTDLDPSGMRARVGHPDLDRDSEVDVSKGSEFYELFKDYLNAFRDEMKLMRKSNLGEDIRTMLRGFFTRKSNSVKLRDGGAFYFAPITTEEVLYAMKELIEDINDEWKHAGFNAEVDPIEVINTAEKRDMVERRVKRKVEEQVGKALESAFEELDEEAVVDEVAQTVEDELESTDDFAETYNALLSVEIAVEDELEAWKEEVTEDKEELIEEVLEEDE